MGQFLKASGALFLAWFTIMGLLALFDPVRGHEAPSGWKYPSFCCNEADCAPADWLGENSAGEAVANTKLHAGVSMSPNKYTHRMTSPDGQYHICATPDSVALKDGKRTYYCIYSPAEM